MSRPRRLLLVLMLVAIGLPLPLTLAVALTPAAVRSVLRSPGLAGFVASPRPISPSAAAWWRGDFQRGIDAWFANRIEPRGWTIRVTNQLYYTLFARSYMYRNAIVVARARYLYELSYLEAYCATAPDEADLLPLVAQIREFRDLLLRHRHQALVMITPSKAVTMPEYLPVGLCDPPQPPERLGANFAALLRQAGVPVIDGAALTRAMKTQDPVPPFPRGGTHWSRLAGARVSVQVMAEIDRLAGTDLGALTLGEPRWDTSPVGSDRDLATLLNLLLPPLDYPTGEATIECRPTTAGRGLNLIGVGGSFLQEILEPIGACGLFASVEQFAYYTNYRERFPGLKPGPVDRAALDWAAMLRQPTVFLLEFNERAIPPKIGWLDAFMADAGAALP